MSQFKSLPKTILTISIGAIGVLALTSGFAFPGKIVYDPTEVAKTIANHAEMAEEVANQVKELGDVSGVDSMGDLMNSENDVDDEEYSAGTWQDATAGEAGNVADDYQQLRSDYESNHVAETKSDYAKGASSEATQNYDDQVRVNRASAVISEQTYNQIDQSLQKLHELGMDISSASNESEKDAIDLNSRIELQVGIIEVENERLLALINQQLASQNATQIASETQISQENEVGN